MPSGSSPSTLPATPTLPAPPARIALRDASVRFGKRQALQDVSLALGAGEIVAVVGPNGAGKSTLLRLLGGLITPTTGTVHRTQAPEGRRLRTAYVPQRSTVDWTFPIDVLGVVLMGAPTGSLWRRVLPFSRGVKRDAAAALETVGLADRATTQIGELSGGQQQRVFLARALMRDCDVLLLDEPFTGVDVPTQDVILRVLRVLAGEGRTVVFATHDLEQAREVADRVVLVSGHIVADGPPETAMTVDSLRATFGGQVIILPTDDGDRHDGDARAAI